MPENQMLLALLIDGDNANSDKIQEILDQISSFGKPLIKKVFGNKSSMDHWQQPISRYALAAVFVPNNIPQKNSVDIALVVEAMTLLYERSDLDGFCIVSSDADYTALVKHIQTKDKLVLGFGRSNTPEPFQNACSKFFSIDETKSLPLPAQIAPSKEATVTLSELSDSEFMKLFRKAYKRTLQDTPSPVGAGWVHLSDLKTTMNTLNNAFQLNGRALAEKLLTFPEIIEVREQTDSKPVLHLVRSLEENEIGRFRRAYISASADPKLVDANGFVTLSAIGTTFKTLYPSLDPLVYQNIKSSQLKKVVEKLISDYPLIFEMKHSDLTDKIRMIKRK